MERFLRPIFALVAVLALATMIIAHPAAAQQADIRAKSQSLALATSNAAITIPLNFGMQLVHWEIVTGATVNSADRLIFENTTDGGTTWTGATVMQSSQGTGTATALRGAITAGSTFTPGATTTYDFWVPVAATTATRVRVSTNYAGDSAAVVSYDATAGAMPVPIGTSIPVSIASTVPVSIGTTVPVSCATPACTSVVYPGTNPFPVTTPAPDPTGAHGGIVVEGVASGVAQPVSIASTVAVSVAPTTIPVVITGSVGENPVAITGGGFTHYPATSMVTSAPIAIHTSAATVAGVTVTWNAPTTATVCWITLYDSTAAPTVGTSPILIAPIVTSSPGVFAFAIPPTIGIKVVNGLWYAASTTPTGATACNTTASSLWFSADYI